jgi:hypothetical protein
MRVVMPPGDFTGEAVISALSAVLSSYYKEGDDKWNVHRFPGTREFHLSGEYGGTVHIRDYVGLCATLFTRIWDGPPGLPRTLWVPKKHVINETDTFYTLTLAPVSVSEPCREFELTYSYTVPGRESEMAEATNTSLTTLLKRFLHQLYEAHNAEAA